MGCAPNRPSKHRRTDANNHRICHEWRETAVVTDSVTDKLAREGMAAFNQRTDQEAFSGSLTAVLSGLRRNVRCNGMGTT